MGQLVRQVFPTLDLEPPGPPRSVAISVVIPCYNAAATIRATLSSVLAQEFDDEYEVIVVDSSDDETPAIIAQEFPSIKLIHCAQRTDPGTARNLGIGRSRGEIIACLDADCVAPADWLRRIVAAQRGRHPIVGGSVEIGNPERMLAWAGFLGEFREFIGTGDPRLVGHLPTCNISYHRTIFENHGGFPTAFYHKKISCFIGGSGSTESPYGSSPGSR